MRAVHQSLAGASSPDAGILLRRDDRGTSQGRATADPLLDPEASTGRVRAAARRIYAARSLHLYCPSCPHCGFAGLAPSRAAARIAGRGQRCTGGATAGHLTDPVRRSHGLTALWAGHTAVSPPADHPRRTGFRSPSRRPLHPHPGPSHPAATPPSRPIPPVSPGRSHQTTSSGPLPPEGSRAAREGHVQRSTACPSACGVGGRRVRSRRGTPGTARHRPCRGCPSRAAGSGR